MNNVTELVLELIKEIGEDQEKQALIQATSETRLFGENLDSLGLVFLVTDLESIISEKFDIDVTLADERAMSQKTSPFRTVSTLIKYVELLITEEKVD